VENIPRQAHIDTAKVELITLGPSPWRDLSNIHFGLNVEDHQFNMVLPAVRVIAATQTLTALRPADIHL